MKKYILSSLCLLLILILAACKKEEVSEEKPIDLEPIEVSDETEQEETTTQRSSTLGFPIDEVKEVKNFFGVMIENSPASRPHTGLVNADVVYEMEVEYDITRFFALFQHDIPDEIGPVRSARHYFLPITESWKAPYIHFGGSKFAYEDFPELSVEHYDGTKNGFKFFKRDNSRKAPHNAYLITERLPKFENKSTNPHFEFSDKPIYDGDSVEQIELSYSSFNDISYIYNEKEQFYHRYLEGSPHIDRNTSEPIKTKNLFVLFAEHKNLNTSSGHIDILFNTEGELRYYFNGKKETGKWKNENNTLVFYDSNNEKLQVAPGNTWIQIVDNANINNVKEQ